MGIGCSLLLIDGFKGARGAGVDDEAIFWGDMAAWASRLGGLSIGVEFAACSGRRVFVEVEAGAGAMGLWWSIDIGFSNTGSWKTWKPSLGR